MCLFGYHLENNNSIPLLGISLKTISPSVCLYAQTRACFIFFKSSIDFKIHSAENTMKEIVNHELLLNFKRKKNILYLNLYKCIMMLQPNKEFINILRYLLLTRR